MSASLNQIAVARGYPKSIRVDNGSEFYSRAMDAWAYHYKVALEFIRPGKPAEKPLIEALMGFKRFKRTAAIVIVSEIGHFGRFEHLKQLMAYLGLVPSEDSSGGRRKQGAITKCGNSHARWMLVESAEHYRKPPKIAKVLSVRQEGLSREVKIISWHAQNRLNKRWNKLIFRGMHPNKIRVAVARELSSYIWDLVKVIG